MSSPLTDRLARANADAGFPLSLACTAEGLPLAVAGDSPLADDLSALTALFDEIVVRARRDLGLAGVDEFTLLHEGRGRFVVRPILEGFFLVVVVPAGASWRRTTTQLCRDLRPLLVERGVPGPA